jgi:hypothetical protein
MKIDKMKSEQGPRKNGQSQGLRNLKRGHVMTLGGLVMVAS